MAGDSISFMKIEPATLAEFDPANFTLPASCLEPQTIDQSGHPTDHSSKPKAKFDKFFYMFPEGVLEGVWAICVHSAITTPRWGFFSLCTNYGLRVSGVILCG